MRTKAWLAVGAVAAVCVAASPAAAKDHDFTCSAKQEERAEFAAKKDCEPAVGVLRGFAIIAD
jgi:hypothetical protein